MTRPMLPERAWNRGLQILAQYAGRWRLLRAGAQLGPGVRLLGAPIVERHADSRLEIGAGAVLCSSSRWTALGVNHPVVLRTLRPGATLRIGAGTGISGGSFCAALSVEIGARCLIGADVLVADTDFHSLNPQARRLPTRWESVGCAAVSIGDDVFIGSRAVILKGVRIGPGSVVGAGAVVTRDVPPGCIVAGNPARVLGPVPGVQPRPIHAEAWQA